MRSGFGLYYGPIFGTFINRLFTNNLPGATTLLRRDIPNLSFPIEPFVRSGTPPVPSVAGIDPSRRDTYAEQWTLNVQRELSSVTVLQVAYVGNRGINLYRHLNINLLDPDLGRRPNPRFADITLAANTGQSVYHALQVSFRRRFAQGLAADAAYTYGHVIDDTLGDEGFMPQDIRNVRAERGNGAIDVRHQLTFNILYNLPIGPSRAVGGRKSRVIGQLLSGWQINSLAIPRAGTPFNVELGGQSPSGNLNTVNQRPDRVLGVPTRPAHQSINQWLNPAAFTVPRRGTFGNLGRNTEYGPGLIQLDASILKTIKRTETRSLQFRAEFFNVLNHPNFESPAATLRSSNFGRIFNTFGRTIGFGTPRQIQFGLKFIY